MAELEAHLAVDTQGNQEPLKAKRIMERIHFWPGKSRSAAVTFVKNKGLDFRRGI